MVSTMLSHDGEGTFLTPEEQISVIKVFVKSVDDKIPIIAGITGEGTKVAAYEAKRAKEAGASAGLLYPSHSWLRTATSLVLLKTDIRLFTRTCSILTCHDEYLPHTAFDIDGFLVGYGNIAPEALIELIEAGKARDYVKARTVHDQLLPVTKAVSHRGSQTEGTVALKHALVA